MITPTCSKCKRTIPSEDINVANDIAFCRDCNLSYRLSVLTSGTELDAGVNLNNPPAGAWYQSNGMGTVIGATHRSIGTALGMLFFTLFWNGILSVFILFALAGTLKNLGVTLPHWFPAPLMNDSPMSVGMTIFLWIFLMPFILVGLLTFGVVLSSLIGRTEVRLQNVKGAIFVGFGALGFTRRFDASQVKEVRIDNKQWRDNEGDRRSKTHIVIELREERQVKFGSMLSEERRKFVASAMRRTLLR